MTMLPVNKGSGGFMGGILNRMGGSEGLGLLGAYLMAAGAPSTDPGRAGLLMARGMSDIADRRMRQRQDERDEQLFKLRLKEAEAQDATRDQWRKTVGTPWRNPDATAVEPERPFPPGATPVAPGAVVSGNPAIDRMADQAGVPAPMLQGLLSTMDPQQGSLGLLNMMKRPDAPSGFARGPDGSLVPIPGGPADPGYIAKTRPPVQGSELDRLISTLPPEQQAAYRAQRLQQLVAPPRREPPAGFREAPGGLEPIPGGPADPNYLRGKPTDRQPTFQDQRQPDGTVQRMVSYDNGQSWQPWGTSAPADAKAPPARTMYDGNEQYEAQWNPQTLRYEEMLGTRAPRWQPRADPQPSVGGVRGRIAEKIANGEALTADELLAWQETRPFDFMQMLMGGGVVPPTDAGRGGGGAGSPLLGPRQTPPPQTTGSGAPAEPAMPLPPNATKAMLRKGQRYTLRDGSVGVWDGNAFQVEDGPGVKGF